MPDGWLDSTPTCVGRLAVLLHARILCIVRGLGEGGFALKGAFAAVDY